MEDSVNPNADNKAVSEKNNIIELKPKSDESIDNLRKLLRPIKYSLVDLFISLARVFFFWLPGGDVGKGQALMVAHFVGGCVLYTLYFILHPNQAFRMFIFFFFVIVIVQQIVFRGCVITKAEQRLTGTDDTILDPWIRLSGFEPTRELRVVCSIGVVGSMTMTLLMNTILDQFRMFS
jgi:hypothetical protein